MQQATTTQDELKNLTIEDLKEKLINLGIHVDSSRKPKKTYIDLILKAEEMRNDKDELFKAPLKALKSNILTASESKRLKLQSYDLGESTRTEDNSYISGNFQSTHDSTSNINNNFYINHVQGNLTKDHDLYLGNKRELIDNKELYSHNDNKFISNNENSNFLEINQAKLLNTNRSNVRHESSKSIKQQLNLTNTVIKDPFNKNNICLKENEHSGVKPFSKTTSKISVISKNRIGKVKTSSFPILRKFKKANEEMDYKLLFSVIGGSLSVYAFIFYLQKYCSKENNCFEFLMKLTNNNIDTILKSSSILLFAVFIVLVYFYFKNKSEYSEYCKNLAKKCYEDTLTYFQLKEKGSSTLTHHISENTLINELSKTFSFSVQKFTEDVYNPFLREMLDKDTRFKIRELVEDGEIKAFYVFEVIGQR